MLKIFWDTDNIGFICDRLNSSEHAHCVAQVFLSFDAPLRITVETTQLSGRCVIVNRNVKHAFSCHDAPHLSMLIEPTSNFSKRLISKIKGGYLICDEERAKTLQQSAAALVNASDKKQYLSFVQTFAESLGLCRNNEVLDERIARFLNLLRDCDCYDHTIERFAKDVALSSSRLSHLFRAQIGVPLKSYLLFHQLEKAFTAILNGSNITDAAMLAGFDSPSHFAATVKKWMGMPVSASLKDSEFLKAFF